MEEGDLIIEEKLALMGLLKGYKTMHGNCTVNPRRRELYREFFKVIFDYIIQDSIIINPDISIINIKTAEPTTSSRIESGIKRELTTQRDAHSKTEAKTSLAEDDDIIFIGAKLLSSAPAPGRCSCRGLCNHYVATIRAPAPAPTPATIHTPAPAMAVQQKSVASSSRTLEDISLISDSEGDDDFPSLPTRKDKERAQAQTSSPRQRFLRSGHGR
ncbi:hypothetical protein CDV31_012286 [Fusarium ambrosium]|uniref:Uncharacterized protein n=1 Tax=Fusarium ambrosium TaxID=131363 RepID=A0A428TB37_9HYPO|nr:hypothetical protein CDV31_012286 [Fusarium ambrosium]